MQLLIYLAKKAVLRCWGICVHPLHNMYARWLLYSSNAVHGLSLIHISEPTRH